MGTGADSAAEMHAPSLQAGLLRPLRIVAIRCFANPPPSAGDGSPTVSADMLHCDVLDIAQLSDHFPVWGRASFCVGGES